MRHTIHIKHDYSGYPSDREKNKKLLTRGGSAGIMLSAFYIVYSYATADVPMLLFCVSFLLFMLHPFAIKFGGKYGNSIANAMKGCGGSLAVGSLAMAYF